MHQLKSLRSIQFLNFAKPKTQRIIATVAVTRSCWTTKKISRINLPSVVKNLTKTTATTTTLSNQRNFHSSITKKMADTNVVSNQGKYQLSEIDGDLFSAPETHSLAHCVGADFAMGAGIAVKFKEIYGQVSELRAQGIQSGGVAVLKDKERYIYYLVTKPQSWGSPTYDSLRSSLTAMREHMRSHNVHKLAIPRIGCGIDGLEWDKVSAELNRVFMDEDLEIVVYNFVPK